MAGLSFRLGYEFEKQCRKYWEGLGYIVVTPRETALGTFKHRDYYGLWDGIAINNCEIVFYQAKRSWKKIMNQAKGRDFLERASAFPRPPNVRRFIMFAPSLGEIGMTPI